MSEETLTVKCPECGEDRKIRIGENGTIEYEPCQNPNCTSTKKIV